MGCSNNSFEINTSKENAPEENQDDYIIGLMKRRLVENQDREIEDNDLKKIKELVGEPNDNKEEEKNVNDNKEEDDEINIIENQIPLKNNNKNNIFSNPDNEKGNDLNDSKDDKDENNNDDNKIKEINIEEINNDNKENDENININNNLNINDDKENGNDTGRLFNSKGNLNKVSILDKYYKPKKSKKISLNKSKLINMKVHKEPFLLKTTKIDSINLSTLSINASAFLREYLIPIWFKKNDFIKFETTGRWRIDKNYDFTNTKGMPTPKTLDFNYGACIARIGSGEPFVILPHSFTYITKHEGPLYLKMNLPRKLEMRPEGLIEMLIYDGEVLPIEEIYKRIGWIENNMEYGNNKGSEMENNLLTSLNNLRMNPVLFYEKNFREVKNILWIEKYLEEKETQKNKHYRKPFQINENYYDLINKYVNNNYVNKKNINKQKVSLYLNNMKENLELLVKNELKCKNLIDCKLIQKYKINDICLLYLLDKKLRNYIFSNEYNCITIKMIENYLDESTLLILCFSKIEEKNDELEIKENNQIKKHNNIKVEDKNTETIFERNENNNNIEKNDNIEKKENIENEEDKK